MRFKKKLQSMSFAFGQQNEKEKINDENKTNY